MLDDASRAARRGREAPPGYGIEDCDALEGNRLAQTVTWRGKADVEGSQGRPVRLRFEGRGAKLYAFQFG
jgi:hypothetical protein